MSGLLTVACVAGGLVGTSVADALATSSTTSQVSATPITLGGTVSDTATVQGNATDGSPTGNVQFYICQIATTQTLTTGPCNNVASNHVTEAHLSAGAGDTATASSGSVTPASAGTWCFSAVYLGDTNYAGSQDNTSGSNLDPNECVLVMTITPTIGSTASHSQITLGPSGTVTDTVSVEGDTEGGSPTGTAVFYVCQIATTQTPTTGDCPATGTPEDSGESVTHVDGDDTSDATSTAFTPSAAGSWCFSVVYEGNSMYSSVSDNTSNANLDANECFLVETAPSSTATTVSSANITLGPSGTVTDSVTVTGNSAGGSPTGQVVFYVCQTGSTQTVTTGACPATGTPEDSGETLTAGASDTATATSASFTPSGGGTWCFSAVYGGDTNYQGSSDNTSNANLDASECVLVGTATSGSATTVSSANITLGPSGTVTDSVTVTGNSAGGSPTGQVVFYVCQTGSTQTVTTGACPATGTPEDSGETLTAGASDTATATSAAFTPSAAGTWCFSAVYGGDTNYQGSSDNTSNANLDASECVLVATASSSTATTVSSANVTIGASGTVTDSVTVTGNSAGGPPTGKVDFYVCGPNGADALCTSVTNAEGSPSLSASGAATATATSAAFSPSQPGIYCFAALYVPASNSNYAASSDNNTGSVDPNECTSVSYALYTITSASSISEPAGQSFSFSVTTYPTSPVAVISKRGRLPKNIVFAKNSNGTATILGTAVAKAAGHTYHITIKARWGKGASRHLATQHLTLMIT